MKTRISKTRNRISKERTITPAQALNFIKSLDDKSRSIVCYIMSQRYADIGELANATGIPHHDILRRLKEVIVPESKKILGKPAVSFEKSRIDKATGERVTLSWWANENLPVFISNVEIFEDNDRVLLVADVPGLDISEPVQSRVHYRNSVLQIELCKEKESVRNMTLEKSID